MAGEVAIILCVLTIIQLVNILVVTVFTARNGTLKSHIDGSLERLAQRLLKRDYRQAKTTPQNGEYPEEPATPEALTDQQVNALRVIKQLLGKE